MDRKAQTGSSHLTEIEKFVKDHLVYINHASGEIEYNFEGDNMTEGFVDNPLIAIRAAIKRISRMKNGEHT